jgi:hypothetical protein
MEMKDFFISNASDFRFERKYFIEGSSTASVEQIVKLHPEIFREVYHERMINSIYFDSHDLENYFENIYGISKRLKVRIRWYGNLFGHIEEPTLELKLKNNLTNAKLLYPLMPFILDNDFNIETVHNTFKNSSLEGSFKSYLVGLKFSLLNRYKRKYFLSSDKKFRITIDSNMTVHKIDPYKNTFLNKIPDYSNTILELKYNERDYQFVDKISDFLPFRLTRSSKYVDGINKLYF